VSFGDKFGFVGNLSDIANRAVSACVLQFQFNRSQSWGTSASLRDRIICLNWSVKYYKPIGLDFSTVVIHQVISFISYSFSSKFIKCSSV
jgi:hypothetical protein